MYDYHKVSTTLLEQIIETNQKVLPQAIEWMSNTIVKDRIIHTFGTGTLPYYWFRTFCSSRRIGQCQYFFRFHCHDL